MFTKKKNAIILLKKKITRHDHQIWKDKCLI